MGISPADQEAYDQLAYYTLAHRDPAFIHQLVVDTFAAQHADKDSKPIYAAFAIAGLYLHNECGFSGKEVQRAHMQLAKNKGAIPFFSLPAFRGEMRAADVLRAEPGTPRDAAIEKWSSSTWKALAGLREQTAGWLNEELKSFSRKSPLPEKIAGEHPPDPGLMMPHAECTQRTHRPFL